MSKLYRSRENKMISGLCGGVSEALNIDATLIRVLLVVLILLSGGAVILIYLILCAVVPSSPAPYGYGNQNYNQYNNRYNNQYNNQHNNQYNGSFNQQDPMYRNPPHNTNQTSTGNWDYQKTASTPPPNPSSLDDMMDDLEKKALRREIEELKSKISKLEKGE